MGNPLGMFDNVMASMRNRMDQMHQNFVRLHVQRFCVVFHLFSLFNKTVARELIVCCFVQENMPTDVNAHSFSSSSVMTYSKVGNEPPKVFQATSSTRQAPGGVSAPSAAINNSTVCESPTF